MWGRAASRAEVRQGKPVYWPCFPGGSAGKESACNTGDLRSIPGSGRSPGEGKGYPLQYSGLENSMDCIVHGVTKSRTWQSDFHFHSPTGTVFLTGEAELKEVPHAVLKGWARAHTDREQHGSLLAFSVPFACSSQLILKIPVLPFCSMMRTQIENITDSHALCPSVWLGQLKAWQDIGWKDQAGWWRDRQVICCPAPSTKVTLDWDYQSKVTASPKAASHHRAVVFQGLENHSLPLSLQVKSANGYFWLQATTFYHLKKYSL